MPSPGGQFFSDEFGDIEDYFVSDYQLIDQYIGDTLWNWGNGNFGALATNAALTRSTPITTILGGTNWKLIECGNGFTATIKTDGTLWSWGSGTSGQLGNNSTDNRNTPVTTILGGTNWKSIASGSGHTAAIKTDGTLWAWGSGAGGGLGNNSTTVRSTPVTTILGGTDWKSIACGLNNILAIKTDGTLWVWGQNNTGQLGINDTINRSTPITTILGGTNWKLINVSDDLSSSIKTDGTLWVWGLGTSGQLGNGSNSTRSIPITTILGGTNWKSVSAGTAHIAAIKTDGTLWTWGNNGSGRLGDNSTDNRNTPVTTVLGGTNWKYVSGGGSNTSAIKTDGTLWVWGNNGSGQLGINDVLNRSIPVTTILGRTNWKSVSSSVSANITALTAGLNVDFS